MHLASNDLLHCDVKLLVYTTVSGMGPLQLRALVVIAALSATPADSSLPTITTSEREHFHFVGEDATLKCSVERRGDPGVLRWLNSTGGLRQWTPLDTTDPRLVELRGIADETYILIIRNLSVGDDGRYSCEFRRSLLGPPRPPVQLQHFLRVSPTFPGARLSGRTELDTRHGPDRRPATDQPGSSRRHLFFAVSCCRLHHVAHDCLRFCKLPGNDTAVNLDRYNCSNYRRTINNCVEEGLPAAPSLQVAALSPTALQVTWQPGQGHVAALPADWFVVTVTPLRSFDLDKMALLPSNETVMDPATALDETVHMFNASSDQRSLNVTSLRPLHMYEMSVAAHSSLGVNTSSDRVRAVTWIPDTSAGSWTPPRVAAVRDCCVRAGIPADSGCLQTLCDRPSAADPSGEAIAILTMVCSRWIEQSFACMTDGRDLRDCCQARGISERCVRLCAPTPPTTIDHLPCALLHMSSYWFCLIEDHGALPSAPLGPRTALVEADWAVLRWNAPERLPDTVLGYTVAVRELGGSGSNDTYTLIADQHSPFLLDRLTGGREYEFFVTAVNDNGESDRSNRVIFETPPAEPDQLEEGSGPLTSVDPAVCCRETGVPPHCQKFCSYSGMAQEEDFGNGCENYWTQIAGCATDGRDTGRCCTVALPGPCRSLCQGRVLGYSCRRAALDLLRCATWQGVTRPPAVTGLHVISVTGDSVTLVWQRQNDTDRYQVFYGKLNSSAAVFHWQNRLNQVLDVAGTTQAQVAVDRDALYGFSVSYLDANGTRAHWGSTLLVNTSAASEEVPTLSPPHRVTIRGVSAHSLHIAWKPPAQRTRGGTLRYRLYYQAEGEPAPRVVNLTDANHNLTGLERGAMYSVWVTAMSEDGAESAPSETVEERTRNPQEIVPTVQLPRIEPREPTEGGNMTIICVATGSPTPTVSLLLDHRLQNESRTHELVTTISKVTRDMTLAQCTVVVELNYLVSSRQILIRRAPRIWVYDPEKESVPGRKVSLSCDIDAHPKPNMTWRGDHSEVLHAGGSLNFTSITKRPGHHSMEMTITNVTEKQFRNYTCHAENEIGADSKQIMLKRRPNSWNFYKLGVSQCCRSMNISEPCQVACAEQEVNLEPVISDPACIKEFNKLMVCAADGSDHRDCCFIRRVPLHCRSWCEGLDTFDRRPPLHPDCVTIYAADIVACFHEGKDLLPGRPRNVVATKLNATAALVRWEEPVRTGDHAVSYRVRWWPLGASSSAHLDTRRTSHLLTRLEPGEQYQVAIRAVNRRGVSLETTAEVGEEGTDPERSMEQGLAPGTSSVLVPALTLTVLVMVLVAAVVWVVRRRRLRRGPGAQVSFTNPAYVREGAIQESAQATQTDRSGGDGSAPGGGQHTTDSDEGWHETALETPVLGRDEHL